MKHYDAFSDDNRKPILVAKVDPASNDNIGFRHDARATKATGKFLHANYAGQWHAMDFGFRFHKHDVERAVTTNSENAYMANFKLQRGQLGASFSQWTLIEKAYPKNVP